MKHAVVGTGYWGKNHVRVGAELVENGTLDSLVLCDVDENRVAELANSYGVDYETDIEELPAYGVDSATIATPSTTHHEIATTLLNKGLDLLVEKPLALDSDRAWDIVDTAEANNATLGVGHIFRYHPALNDLKQRIDRGDLGQIKYLNTNRFSFRVPRETTGALYSLAVHDVDIYSYLLGQTPETLYCELDSVVRDNIDETATLVLEYDGATGVINESWQVPVFGKRRDLIVVGTERSAYIDYLEDTVVEVYDSAISNEGEMLRAREEGQQTYEAKPREPLRVEVEEFLEACESKSTPRASGRVGAKAVELLEMAQLSDSENRVVDLSG